MSFFLSFCLSPGTRACESKNLFSSPFSSSTHPGTPSPPAAPAPHARLAPATRSGGGGGTGTPAHRRRRRRRQGAGALGGRAGRRRGRAPRTAWAAGPPTPPPPRPTGAGTCGRASRLVAWVVCWRRRGRACGRGARAVSTAEQRNGKIFSSRLHFLDRRFFPFAARTGPGGPPASASATPTPHPAGRSPRPHTRRAHHPFSGLSPLTARALARKQRARGPRLG